MNQDYVLEKHPQRNPQRRIKWLRMLKKFSKTQK